jgi:hypothetical protein
MSGQTKSAKHIICVNNSDGTTGSQSPNDFAIQFNNSAFTNIQSGTKDPTKVHLTPQLFSCDWFFNNINSSAKNNKFVVSGTNITNGSVVIPDGIYDGVSLASTIQGIMNDATTGVKYNGAVMAWVITYVPASSKMLMYYSTAGATNVSIRFSDFANSVFTYDITKVLGMYIFSNSIYTKTIASSGIGASIVSDTCVDLNPYQVIRLHSNVAKRTFAKKGGGLTTTDILFEIPTYNQAIGSTLTFPPISPDLYRQEIVSNFDYMTFQLRDKYGGLIPLPSSCEANFTFVIEREITEPTNADRMYSIGSYTQFSNM